MQRNSAIDSSQIGALTCERHEWTSCGQALIKTLRYTDSSGVGPRFGRFGLFEFHRAAEAIALGVEATEKALDQLGEAIAALACASGPPQEVAR